MSRKLLPLLPLFGLLCMGQSEYICTPAKPKIPITLITDEQTYSQAPGAWNQNFFWFTMDTWEVDPETGPIGNREEHPLAFQSEANIRMYLHGASAYGASIGRDGDIFFSGPQPLRGEDSIGAQATAVPEDYVYGKWWSVSKGDGGLLDIDQAFAAEGYENAVVTSAAFYDEGACSLTLPYYTTNLDPFLRDEFPEIAEVLGSGVARLVGEGWDEGMKGLTGRQESSNEAWYADFISGLRRSEHASHGTSVYATYSGLDWDDPHNGQERTDNEICIRSYLLFNGRLEWKGDDSLGEAFGWLLGGGWLPDLLGIGECPGERLTAVTVCGEFTNATGGEEYLVLGDGIDTATADRLPVPVGSLVFKHSDIVVNMNRWPHINFICNNNKGKYENGIKTAIAGTIDESFNALIQDKLGSEIPFTFRRVFMTPEGLTLVIANNENDQNYLLANLYGLCGQRPADSGQLKSRLETMPSYTAPPINWP